MSQRIAELIQHLELLPHPEGGYYSEKFRSEELLLHPDLKDGRSLLTSIYFLITEGNFSAFHRIDSDELWYYHEGATCNIHIIHQGGGYSVIKLGNEIHNQHVFQGIVKAGDWFASETTGGYTLVSCAVAPGFDFSSFELADQKKMMLSFPEHQNLIERLTRQ